MATVHDGSRAAAIDVLFAGSFLRDHCAGACARYSKRSVIDLLRAEKRARQIEQHRMTSMIEMLYYSSGRFW